MSNHVTDRQHEDRNTAGALLPRLALLLALVVPAAGCDILDVENPNELVDEDVHRPEAARAMVNGALATVSRGIAQMSAPYSTATDELKWVGSRDAWFQLDQGNVIDPANEFTDAAYPYLSEGRWMADEAIRTIQNHLEEQNTAAMRRNLGRAYLIGGVVYTAIGDMMDDFVFSDRMEAEPPVGEENMDQVYQQAIDYLTQAISIAEAEGLDDLRINALAMRARAKHAQAVWVKINQDPVPDDPLVAAGEDDARAVIAEKGLEDWMYRLTYSSETVSSSVAFQVNERRELLFGERFVDINDDDEIEAFTFEDPITGEIDARFLATAEEFLESSSYAPITQASNREMHLIVAEAQLAQENETGDDSFTAHINHVRENITGVEPYGGEIPPVEMLEHERTANLFLQNRRLADMYRFGTDSPEWLPDSAAATQPGEMLPITVIEIRANEHISG